MRRAYLFAAGLLMEAIWAVGTQSLQNRNAALAFGAAAFAPFVAGISTSWQVVDERDWRRRLENIAWYSAGACAGLAMTFPW